MLFRTIISAVVAGIIAGSASFLIQHRALIPLIYQAETHEQTTSHENRAGEPSQNATTRATYTLIGDILLASGFGLILCAAYLVTGRLGTWSGIGWGLAGFATFHLGPAVVVPPLLPGIELGSLATRQALWLAAAFATALGLGLLAFGRKLLKIVGAVLLVLPLLIAERLPIPSVQAGSAAIEHSFIVWSLVGALVMWLLVGTLSGTLFAHFEAGDVD